MVSEGMKIREQNSSLYPGNSVEVRPAEEIFGTLNENGTLVGMPFMPEMLEHCGKRFRVSRRVEKTCVEGDTIRRMRDFVFLEGLRCSGAAHGGCEKECMIFWHKSWLRKVDPVKLTLVATDTASPSSSPQFPYPTFCPPNRYICQSTELIRATAYLSRWDIRQHWREWRSKTYTPCEHARLFFMAASVRMKIVFRGMGGAFLRGTLTKTPGETLNLQPGEIVEVKSRKEIAATLNYKGQNKGLGFGPMMLPFCGQRFRVRKRITKLISEETGQLRNIDNTVALEGSVCDGHVFWGGCPRLAYHYWREIWLKRV